MRNQTAQHTPGPWRFHVRHSLHDGPVVDTLAGEFVASTADDDSGVGIADAKLIAAAPDMLAALEDLIKLAKIAMGLANRDGADFIIDEALSAARSAVAKAKELK